MKNLYYKLVVVLLIIVIPGYYYGLHLYTLEPMKVGDRYLHSFDWESEDPFENIEVDTVTIIAIKGDYVQWKTGYGTKLSGKIKYFRRGIRPIK
jgi:hypothetical protein